MQHQMKCTRLLRRRLTSADTGEYPSIISQVLRLFCCEILLRNAPAAKVHGRVFRRLLEISAANGIDITSQLTYALYHDTNPSAMFLVRPTFDVCDWAPKIFESSREKASSEFPHLSEKQPECLDQSIATFWPLTQLLVQLRD